MTDLLLILLGSVGFASDVGFALLPLLIILVRIMSRVYLFYLLSANDDCRVWIVEIAHGDLLVVVVITAFFVCPLGIHLAHGLLVGSVR